MRYFSDGKPLNASMDNVLAWRLGLVAQEAMSEHQKVGDPIDRGLILARLLKEKGFIIMEKQD